MKRILILTALLLVFALAAPASAATWRTYGNVRADGGWFASLSGSANNVQEIQVGLYTFGTGRTVEYDYSWSCDKGSNYKSNYRSGLKTTTKPKTWKWVTVRSTTSGGWDCDFHAAADVGSGSHRLKVRVR